MSFKYINPGSVSLLDGNVTQDTDLVHSNTGLSYRTNSFKNGVHIPYFQSTTYYLKFDIYVPPSPVGSSMNCYIRFPYVSRYYANDVDVSFYIDSTIFYSLLYANGSNYFGNSGGISNTSLNLKANNINTIYFVLSCGANENDNNTYFYMIVNNTKRICNFSTFNKFKSSSYTDLLSIWFSSLNYAYYISNIIFSDSPIDYSEKAITVPISEVYTDMSSLSSGLYVADSVDQSLLASLDINSLLNDVSANSKVTGIMVSGEPIYTTGEGEVSVISKSNDSVTEMNTIALSENSLQSLFFGWDTNITLNDLSNTQLGFKAR